MRPRSHANHVGQPGEMPEPVATVLLNSASMKASYPDYEKDLAALA